MSAPTSASKTKAAELLLRARVLSKEQFDRVIALVMQSGERAEEVLIENDLMSEGDLLKALSGVYQTHFVSTDKLAKADIPRGTVQMIPRRVSETLGVFPVVFDREKNVLSVVTADPDLADVLRDITLVSTAGHLHPGKSSYGYCVSFVESERRSSGITGSVGNVQTIEISL